MKHAIHFLAGLLLGSAVIVCTGAASAVSQMVTATLTTSPIFLDGSEVTLQGYNIGGHNYFKLRDIAALLDFNVYWDDGVYMESDAPYTGQKPEPAATGLSQVRLDVISMFNRLRNQKGLPDLAISQPLMEAAQECADRHYTWHHNREECEAVIQAGYPYGFGSNLTVFTGTAESTIAQKAVDNWVQSPGHYRTMMDAECDSIGVGIAVDRGITYCYLFVGNPNTHNPYG